MNIAFASPSYKRARRCTTNKYLPMTRLYVDEKEAEAYRQANETGEIVACPEGVQGNLPRVRNYILDTEFGNGADVVVMMDDDIESISVFRPKGEFGYDLLKLDAEGVLELVEYGSTLCKEWGFGMWGVNLTDDKLLYKHFKPFTTNRAAVGQFMVFVENELRFDESLPLKEDYDMSLQQLNRYRGVLRLNFAHVKADMGNMAGGTSVRRNFEREHEQFVRFRRKWGSAIVTGASTTRGQGSGSMKGGYLGGWDFSHPTINVPIKGV